MNIVEKFETFEDWANNYEKRYSRKENASVQLNSDGIYITDLTHALERGKDVDSYTIRWDRWKYDTVSILNFVAHFDYNLNKILEFLKSLEYQEYRGTKFEFQNGEYSYEVEIFQTIRKGVRVFSPFALGRLKPLKTAPKKWTVNHAIRAIVNGQVKNLKCDGYYTDDYAYDAADNFGKREISAPLDFAKRIVESPSGWWVLESGRQIHLSCYHFDNNSFEMNL